MATYITRTAGVYGGLITKKLEDTVGYAGELGIRPMSFYYYDDKEESDAQLSSRLDGVLAGFSYGDNFILQLPALMSIRYLNTLFNKLDPFRQHSSSKLIIYMHDDLLFDGSLASDSPMLPLINRADVLIVNSPQTARLLKNQGITKPHLLFFRICDFHSAPYKPMPWQHSLSLLSYRQEIVNQLTGIDNVSLNIFDSQAPQSSQYQIQKLGPVDDELSYQLSQSGSIGVIWPSLAQEAYCTAYQLGIFLSSGLPIATKEGTIEAQWVADYGIGIVGRSLGDIVSKINELSAEDYERFCSRVKKLGALTREGGFTKHAMLEAIKKEG